MLELCSVATVVMVSMVPSVGNADFKSVAGLPQETTVSETEQPATDSPEGVTERPYLLLVETDDEPVISLSWYSLSRGFVRYSQRLPYEVDADRVPVGDNVEAFAAIAGTRIVKSAGHPKGSMVKAGFYKLDSGKPWFEDIDTSKPITVTISGVRFNQPVQAPVDTSMLHTKYAQGDLESCGLPGSARECYSTGSPIENLNGKCMPGIDTRLGGLSDSGPGSAVSSIDSEGLVTVTATFPYRFLKNLQDPWASDLPGTFLEPVHFHFEFEAIPDDAEPIDWEQRRLERQRFLDGAVSPTESQEAAPASTSTDREEN